MSKPLREPLFKTTSFVFRSFREMQAALYGDSKDYFYVRDGHPTLEALERTLLSYEPADFAWVFSSGMSAISTGLFALLSQGDHVVVQKEIYGLRAYCSKSICRVLVFHAHSRTLMM